MISSISVGDVGYVIISRTELGVVAALLDHLDRLVQSIGVSLSDIRLVPEQQTVQEHTTHKLKTHKTLQKARQHSIIKAHSGSRAMRGTVTHRWHVMCSAVSQKGAMKQKPRDTKAGGGLTVEWHTVPRAAAPAP